MQYEIPICPITQEPIRDAVIDPEGNSYERSAILEWLDQENVSPITRSALFASNLIPNRALMDIIALTENGPPPAPRQPTPRQPARRPTYNTSSMSNNLRSCVKCNNMIQVSEKYKGKKSPMCFACRPKACKQCTFLNDSNLMNCEMCTIALD